MSEVDLNDLRIDHRPVKARRGSSVLVIIVFLIIGLVGGYLAARWYPDLLGEAGEDPGADNGANATKEKQGADDGDGASSSGSATPRAAGFTEGGWIEVPSYHPIVISSLIPGRLEELNVLEGSRVRAGDVIAKLYRKDEKDALDRAVAEVSAAEADLKRLKTGFRVQEVEKASADLAAAQADMVLKRQVMERTEALLDTGAVSREQLEIDQAAFREAEAHVEALRQEQLLKKEGYRVEEVEAAEAEVARRRALLELARNRYDYTVVKSPVDGVVLERFVTPGTYIPVQNPRIVSLYDPCDLQVRVDVRLEDIASVSIGQEVDVFTDVEPGRIYKGKVIRIDPLADFKKNTIQVKVQLLATSDSLHPEMIARIRFMGKPDDEEHDDTDQ